MHLLKRACLLAIVASLPPAATAETLNDAWAVALQSHQRIAAAEAERDAASRGLDGARAARKPRVDLMTTFTQMDTAPRFAFGDSFLSPPLFSNDNFVVASAQVSVPLYTGGLISRGIDAAQSMADASQWQLDTINQDVRLAVAEHYIGVLRASSALEVARSNVATLTSHTADARNQFDLGAVPQNDFLAASVSLSNARQGEMQAVNRLELARYSYNRMLSRPMTTPVELDPHLPLDVLVPAGRPVEALIEQAIANRHELKGFAARAEALQDQSSAERARSRPQLALTGGYSLLENEVLDEDRFWLVGIGVQWNLFDGGRSRNLAARFDRQASAVRHERADAESLIALQVREAWLAREEARSRGDVAEAAVEQATENLRVVRDRYKAGAGTNTEVLDAETLRAQTLNNRDDARADNELATLRLARAIGAL